jgi:hypothetical protein
MVSRQHATAARDNIPMPQRSESTSSTRLHHRFSAKIAFIAPQQ